MGTPTFRALIAALPALLLLAYAPAASAFNPPYNAPTWYYLDDSFTAGDPSAPPWQIVLGTWVMENGTYDSTVAASTAITTITDYPDWWFSGPVVVVPFGEYRVYASMLNQSAGAGSTVGLVYHYQDAANYREAVFSATGTADLRFVVDGVVTTVASAPYQGGGQGVRFDVEVDVNGGASTVKVNGSEVLQHVGPDASGQVGLSTHNALAKFDNFSIQTPVGTQPFQENFDNGTSQNLTARLGQWSVAGGTYNSNTVQQASIALTPLVGDQYVHTFFMMRARMLNPYGASGNQVGIVFNFSDDGNYDEIVFSPLGVARINQVSDGTVATLATAAYGGHRNQWLDVTFDMQYTNFNVVVDGKKLFGGVANPRQIPDGALGLITHWAPGKFDDLWVGYSGGLRFSEEFNAGLPAGWSVSGDWSANQGTLNASSVVNTASVATGAAVDTDYVLRARMLNQYGASGNLVGLIYQGSAGSQGKGDRYEVVFAPTGQAHLDKYIKGVRSRIASAAHGIPSNTWFNVEVERNGSYTTVRVNGARLFDRVLQAQLPTGSVGLVTHWTKARFDDVSLNELPR